MNKKTKKRPTPFRFRRFARKSYSVFNSLHKAVTIGVLSGSALLSAQTALAEPMETTTTETFGDSITHTELDEVLVTATKAALPLNLAARLVTVVTAPEVERSPARSIEDLLQYVTGADILQRGPHGVQADISLRGGSFDQTAILLNGVNLTSPQTGHYSFDIPINLSDIDHIEVVQGPSSLIYGAGAFSGGVNIITKKDTQSGASAKLEGGMHGLFGVDLRGAYKKNNLLHTLSGGYKRSDGYIRNSDYRILNLLWQSRYTVQNAHVDFQAGVNDKAYGANTFYTARFPNQFDKTRTLFLSLKGESSGKLKMTPHIYWSRHYDEFQLIRDGAAERPDWYTGHNYHRSDLFGMNLNMQYASDWGITNFGGEFRNEGILSNVLGHEMKAPIGRYTKSDNRSSINYFVEHNFVFNRITLALGGLLQHHTALPNQYGFYPALNASFRATQQLTLFSSWNRATRMPTFTDLYYTTQTHIGNHKLKPEESESLEGGIRLNHPIVKGDLTVFYMVGKNMIDWVKPSVDALWESKNHTRIHKNGFETNLRLDLNEWLGGRQPFTSLNIGYMYLNQKKADDDLISNYTLNHLRHKFTMGLFHRVINNLTLSWHFRWQDRAGSYVLYTDGEAGEVVDYAPFAILDLKAAYQLKQGELFIHANNLLNATHVDLGNIPQPGFWLSGGVSYRF